MAHIYHKIYIYQWDLFFIEIINTFVKEICIYGRKIHRFD